jgi:hypothetical protein
MILFVVEMFSIASGDLFKIKVAPSPYYDDIMPIIILHQRCEHSL